MKNQLRKHILNQKNDSIKETFCFSLFEDGVFDQALLEKMILELRKHKSLVDADAEVKSLSHWIMACVDQCFYAHHDQDDLFIIENYTFELESKWLNQWKKEISAVARFF